MRALQQQHPAAIAARFSPIQRLWQVLVEDQHLVCVYFTASWCGPCKKMAPIVDALSLKHKNVKFVKVLCLLPRRMPPPLTFLLQVDVDALREIAEESGVESVPTFALYQKDNHLTSIIGADVVGLEAALIKHQL